MCFIHLAAPQFHLFLESEGWPPTLMSIHKDYQQPHCQKCPRVYCSCCPSWLWAFWREVMSSLLVWSSEDTTGSNHVSLKLACVFSQLKGCPIIVTKFTWEFGMTNFLLRGIDMLKLFCCESIAMMNFNDNILLWIKISNLECFLCYELFSVPISIPIKLESGFQFRIFLQPQNNESIQYWFVFNGWIKTACF